MFCDIGFTSIAIAQSYPISLIPAQWTPLKADIILELRIEPVYRTPKSLQCSDCKSNSTLKVVRE